MIFFPAILFPVDESGVAGCTIPGPNINAGGSSDEAALQDAVEVLLELFREADAEGEPRPAPATVEHVLNEIVEVGAGQLVWLHAVEPAAAA